jgi:hypothetical protein
MTRTTTALSILLAVIAGAGCADKSTNVPPQNARTIDDIDYVHGQYFFLQRPVVAHAGDPRIDFSTLQVFLDDRNGTNDQDARAGYAEIDPTGAAGTSPRLVGAFTKLAPLADYEVTTRFYGDRYPVLILKQPIANSQVLAIAYVEDLSGGGTQSVGTVPPCTSAGCDSVRLGLIQAPRDVLLAKAGDPDYFETDLTLAPFNVTRDYEIKSVYDLGVRNIDVRSMRLEVRQRDSRPGEFASSYLEGGTTYSYLRILGVDLFRDSGSGSPLAGPDGTVDEFTNAEFLDFERGILVFPDLRPFDPRISGRPDAQPVDLEFFRSRLVPNADVPGLRGRVLWPAGLANPPGSEAATTPPGLEANPAVYDKRSVSTAVDRRYYLYFSPTRPVVTALP